MRSSWIILCALCASGLAWAHVELTVGSIAPEGGYLTTAFQIPHGCHLEGNEDGPHFPTASFQAVIPSAVANASTARPEMKANWNITISDNADGTRTLLWSAISPEYYIADEYFMEFGISIKVPPGAEGDSLLFPATQFCTNNTQTAWVDTSEDAENPAPALTYASETCSCGGDTSTTTIQPVNVTSQQDNTATNGEVRGAAAAAVLAATAVMTAAAFI